MASPALPCLGAGSGKRSALAITRQPLLPPKPKELLSTAAVAWLVGWRNGVRPRAGSGFRQPVLAGKKSLATAIAATTASMAPEAARLWPVAPLMEESGGGAAKRGRTALASARSVSGGPGPW